MRPLPRTTRAFTLLEVLAATAMVAVLAAVLLSSLHVAMQARESVQRALGPVRACETAVSILKDDLQSAIGAAGLLAGQFVGTTNAGAPDGRADSLSFFSVTSDVDPDTGIGDIRRVDISCEAGDDPNAWVIMRRLTTNLLATQTPVPREEVLCRGVRMFMLRYFDGTNWTDTWDSTTQNNVMPKAVEITVELNEPPVQSMNAWYRLTRVVLIPCGQGVGDANQTGTSSSTGGGSSS